jgi:hypothetical protein
MDGMSDYEWTQTFREIFDRGVTRYQEGKRSSAAFFETTEKAFLASIGCTPQELYDLVEDHCNYNGEPDFGTVLLVAAVRRDYFLVEMEGKTTGREVPMSALPPKDAKIEGIEWLPRLLEKAKIKLRGEMPGDLMYGCSGDRQFLKKMGIHPADFLRHVWASRGDDAKVVAWVKSKAKIG